MGFEKFKRPLDTPYVASRVKVPSTEIQVITSTAISSSSTDAALVPINKNTQLATVRTQGSGAGWEIKLSTGRQVGTTVTVSVATDSTADVRLLLESTTQTLFGSTFNALTWSTDSSGTAVTLTKVSTGIYTGVWDAAKVTPGGSTGTV
jgi:hypothetical protein